MEFIGTFWALAPSIIAITLALITKEVYSSLFIGILAGALLYTGFSPVGTLDTIVNDGFIGGLADPWNAGIMLFLVILGILVALINQAGGSEAFGRWASRNIKSRVGIMLATFIFGVLIFVDDYFNCLTVGSVMRPLSDNQRISRAKLAFLIDATAAPICMIAPISSWAAAVSGVVDESVYSGIELFIRAIPYNFYSILTIVFIITIIFMKLDYGPMAMYEKRARETGELGVLEGASSETAKHGKGRVMDLILPIALLIVFCVLGMIYVGGFFNGVGFVSAFGGTDASVGLPWGTLVALVITIIYFICRRVMTFKEAMAVCAKGLRGHGSSIADPYVRHNTEEHDWSAWSSRLCRWCYEGCCPRTHTYASGNHLSGCLRSGLCNRHILGDFRYINPDCYGRVSSHQSADDNRRVSLSCRCGLW